MNDERAYLQHARDAINTVLGYTEDGGDAFFADRKTQDAVIRNIEVLGPSRAFPPRPAYSTSRFHVSAETRVLDESVPWRKLAGMRDKLIHEYFGVDLALVWDVVERKLPMLRPKIAALLETLND